MINRQELRKRALARNVSPEEKAEVLTEAGWSTWYNPNYWVHTKTVADPNVQDHTDYGLPLDSAFEFEIWDASPFDPVLKMVDRGFELLRSVQETRPPAKALAPLERSKTTETIAALKPSVQEIMTTGAALVEAQGGAVSLTPVERIILIAIADLRAAGAMINHITLVAALSGYTPNDGAFTQAVAGLCDQGLIVTGARSLDLTDAGREHVGAVRERLQSVDVASAVIQHLPRLEGLILDDLYRRNGEAVTREVIAMNRGKKKVDGALQKALMTLQSLELTQKAPGNKIACADMVYFA